MALDARHRSSIHEKFVPLLGEEVADGFRRRQAFLLGAIAAATAVLGTLTSVF